MTIYTLNKYDFKKYLLAELPDTRQEELIFWKKTIPMPVDLIYNIFDFRGELFAKYIDHIGAAYLYMHMLKSTGKAYRTEMETQPTKSNRVKETSLRNHFIEGLKDTDIRRMMGEMADILMLSGYNPEPERFLEAICHEGKKYKRLYLPKQMREIITRYNPELLESIGLSNWDMYSNVVADVLKIYRMGFADAFSGIFNKLLEFIIRHSGSSTARGNYSSAAGLKIIQDDAGHALNEPEPIYGRISDGSIWEPRYSNAKSAYIINKHHPFIHLLKSNSYNSEEIIREFISSLAEIENETIRDTERLIIENLRNDLSRKLRIKAEEFMGSLSK
ncbi:hypothetical protein KIH41_16905 [Litoribacter ruber]|uniref:hypothetical protein n=1 Tax=Litoribacter ruber TaxID=702568 RepID=UPI001BDB10C6|nr:hypothetical protein [Litoribacter ruber]MBT0812969.1 hypothetical protein [Litoribacter ruber]